MTALRYAELMSLGTYLKREYKQRGWSQRRAADEWGVPLTTLNGLVNDESLPNLPTLRKLADALQVSIVRLIEIAGYGGTDAATNLPRPLQSLDADRLAYINQMSDEDFVEFLDTWRKLKGDR